MIPFQLSRASQKGTIWTAQYINQKRILSFKVTNKDTGNTTTGTFCHSRAIYRSGCPLIITPQFRDNNCISGQLIYLPVDVCFGSKPGYGTWEGTTLAVRWAKSVNSRMPAPTHPPLCPHYPSGRGIVDRLIPLRSSPIAYGKILTTSI